jgi:asparagine synthase (glutamine-hydrolysing)
VWDRRERQLVLAVDHFGVKRLYFVTDGRRTAFASRASALRAAPQVEGGVDPTAVYNYLNCGFVPAPGSIFSGTHRLAPAHCLVVRSGEGTAAAYWEIAYAEQSVREAVAVSTMYRLTEEAVARAIRGAAPKDIGAFLSGGTDSSTVVGLMSRLTGERVNAFSIGFPEERYDELDYARLVAGHFGAAHYTHIVSPEEALAVLPRLVDAYDEPFGNNSAIGTFVCARLARESRVTRLLAGDGGDEIFGGNERYRRDRIFARYHRIPRIVRRGLLEPILLGLGDGGPSVAGRARRYIRRANLPNPRRFYSWEFFFAGEGADLLAPDFRASVDALAPYTVAQTHYDRAGATAELNRLLYLDLKLAIGDNDLLKVTRTAELAGVDVRFPLLDLALVEFTAVLPARHKLRGLEKRYLFKRAFARLLPPATLAKRKHGFGVPTSTWLRSHREFRDLARDTLSSARARQRGYFEPGALDALLQLHAADTTPYYGDILWTVLMLEMWHRRHVDRVAAA